MQIAALLFLISIPMAAIYWMLAILFHNTVAAVGVGLATVVPIVLAINTRLVCISHVLSHDADHVQDA